MPGWSRPAGLVYEEFKQAREEGKDPAALESLRAEQEAAGEDYLLNRQLHARMLELPVAGDFPFHEPDDLESILALRPAREPAVRQPGSNLFDQLHGAWLGRCIGCALGKPFESMGMRGVDTDGVRPWRRLKRYLTAISPGEWPIRSYVPGHSPAGKEEWVGEVMCPASTRERIAFAETDDDLRYTVLGLILLGEAGLSFATRDVANNWLRHLPYKDVCTAETQAYRNLVARYEFHADEKFGGSFQEIDWQWVATYGNPYREWIGAQIRIDAYGYAAPGDAAAAARMAWTDARMSHTKNGIYGAMFCSAMIAAAFTADDPAEIVESGLAQIPATSRLASAIKTAREIARQCQGASDDVLLDTIHEAFEGYSTVHTIPNAALCAASILAGDGDFERSVTLAVMGAWDTDCNGATVGSVIGAYRGASAIPKGWSDPLNDTLRSGIVDYHPVSIQECARRSLALLET